MRHDPIAGRNPVLDEIALAGGMTRIELDADLRNSLDTDIKESPLKASCRADHAGAEVLYEPAVHPEYHEHYYGAFVRDPDGNNVEAVCHTPA